MDVFKLKYHFIAFCLGFLLDLIIGDPQKIPHPVQLIGAMIAFFELRMIGGKNEGGYAKFNSLSGGQKRRRGIAAVALVCAAVAVVCAMILLAFYKMNAIAGIVVESVMTCQILALKSLRKSALKVYAALDEGNISEARRALSMIVGRDTAALSESQIAKAAIETVAENTCDGVIAPMIYTAIGGPVLGFLFKTVSTFDSMIGYKNERYLDFGRFAAKCDDALNFIPSRISAWLMVFSCLFLGKGFSAKNAMRIFLRDRQKHDSPNAAQTESACAGALGLELSGPAYYGDVLEKKPFIGDPLREAEHNDIKRACRLSYSASFLLFGFCAFVMAAVIAAGRS